MHVPRRPDLSVEKWNATERAYPRERCVHDLVAEQAALKPEAIAVSQGPRRLTYGELEERANKLAHALHQRGVGTESRVAICIERSVDAIVGLLGILKAGAAYVPLDPAYPVERLRYMARDARVTAVVTTSELEGALAVEPGVPAIRLDVDWKQEEAWHPGTAPPRRAGPENLAYIIYTSGSTGQPKGVAVPHRGVVRLVRDTDYARFGPDEVMLQLTSLSFDVSMFEIWGALLNGARLALYPPVPPTPDQIEKVVSAEGVTTAWLTAGLFHEVVELRLEALRPLRQLLAGGDVLSVKHVERTLRELPDCVLINGYGPTESTGFACCHSISSVDELRRSVPIGGPIANTQGYVLDEEMNALGIGVAGELYLGGDGLARGYWQRPTTTAERFVPNPFGKAGTRLYRTGDRCQWRADGTLEFIGRVDNQVKIRGYRIELGEVEEALRRQNGVGDAAVVVRGESAEEKQLVAYVTPAAAAADGGRALRASLERDVPGHMVPSIFVGLDSLPLNANGKVDRKSLPAPVREIPKGGDTPQGPVEEALARIWCDVLGLPHVGRHDNFFDLGGDSILSMQIAARAQRVKISLDASSILELPTIADLASATTEVRPAIPDEDQGITAIPLTPIQRWYFESDPRDAGHFNQSLVFELQAPVTGAELKRALAILVQHHDALRVRFVRARGEWTQEIPPRRQSAVPVEETDFSAVPASAVERAVLELIANNQARIRLARPPLVRAAIMRMGRHGPDRLLLVVHHLVTDGVSWRILVDDLESALAAGASGNEISLPAKSTSFGRWARSLAEHSASGVALRSDSEYWRKHPIGEAGAIPVDRTKGDNRGDSLRLVSVSFTPDETRTILTQLPRMYGASMNAILLAPLAVGLLRWLGRDRVVIDIEGHGREQGFLRDVDLTRTVGWFTSIFPFELDGRSGMDVVGLVSSIDQHLRGLPRKGFGYGVLRYLTDDPSLKVAAGVTSSPALSFNYLGQFDRGDAPARFLRLTRPSTHADYGPRNRRFHLIEVDGYVLEGRMTFEWGYSVNRHRAPTVTALARSFAEHLRELIDRPMRASREGESARAAAALDGARLAPRTAGSAGQ